MMMMIMMRMKMMMMMMMMMISSPPPAPVTMATLPSKRSGVVISVLVFSPFLTRFGSPHRFTQRASGGAEEVEECDLCLRFVPCLTLLQVRERVRGQIFWDVKNRASIADKITGGSQSTIGCSCFYVRGLYLQARGGSFIYHFCIFCWVNFLVLIGCKDYIALHSFQSYAARNIYLLFVGQWTFFLEILSGCLLTLPS